MPRKKKVEEPISDESVSAGEDTPKTKTTKKEAKKARATKTEKPAKTEKAKTEKVTNTKKEKTPKAKKEEEVTPTPDEEKNDPQTDRVRTETGRKDNGQFCVGNKFSPGRKHIPSKLLRMARDSAEKIWPLVEEMAMTGDKDAIEAILKYGMPKTKLCVDDPDIVSDKCKQLLRKIATGKLSVKDAAIEFEKNGIPLPETVRILLSKQEPEPEDDGDVYCTASNEEIERRHMAAAEEENVEEWLDKRREEMDQLHREMSDSYAPGAMPESGERSEDDVKSEEEEGEKR